MDARPNLQVSTESMAQSDGETLVGVVVVGTREAGSQQSVNTT